jgi:hypothetical protein
MKNKAVLLFLTLFSLNGFAYQITVVNGQGVSDEDLVSMSYKSVKGDCQIVNGKYNCQTESNSMDGLAVKYLKQYLDATKTSSASEKLVDLNFKIKGKAFANCNHIEARGQNVTVTLVDIPGDTAHSGCF